MTKRPPSIGEFIKIHIPGECCWAEVMSAPGDEILQVRIDNDVGPHPDHPDPWIASVVPPHPYRCNDVIYVHWRDEWSQYSSEPPERSGTA